MVSVARQHESSGRSINLLPYLARHIPSAVEVFERHSEFAAYFPFAWIFTDAVGWELSGEEVAAAMLQILHVFAQEQPDFAGGLITGRLQVGKRRRERFVFLVRRNVFC